MAGKITKKELKKPDLIHSVFQKVMNYTSKNKSKIYLLSGIIFLVLFISGGWYLFQLNHKKNAMNIFNQAYDLQINGNLNQAVKSYRDLTSKYPGTGAADFAFYHLGNLYFHLHEIDASIKAYQELLRRTPENDILILAHVGLGYCYESKKNFKDALRSFEMALKTDMKGSFEGINYRNIARVYEQMNNRAKAIEYYQKALDKNTDDFVDLLIKRKISSLEDPKAL
jgi:tetratricopeptide (TPR) repeat protein